MKHALTWLALLAPVLGWGQRGYTAPEQERKYKVAVVGFYNLENLFDTLDGPNDDEEFLPGGPRHYTGAVYMDKLDHLSQVIAGVGAELNADGLAVMGCAEVENASVLRDLVAQPRLAPRGYRYVHYDSPDERGIDVGLLYNPAYFAPRYSEPLYVDNRNPDGTPRRTRDVLYVAGDLLGEPVHFLVAHWPSRRGGQQASAAYRAQAAQVCRHKMDSILGTDPGARIILMGDLNDDPVDASVTEVIGATPDTAAVHGRAMYNPWVAFYRQGRGTLAYRDAWNLFDQILLSPAWLRGGDALQFRQAFIYRKEWMVQQQGRYRGYPLRTYNFNRYQGGYSDHFPTYVLLLLPVTGR
jgi:hypothetical protein